MNRAETLLPTLPLWLAAVIALATEAAMLTGLTHWPAPSRHTHMQEPLEISLVAVPTATADVAPAPKPDIALPDVPEPSSVTPEPIQPVAMSTDPLVRMSPKRPVKPKPLKKSVVQPKPAPALPQSVRHAASHAKTADHALRQAIDDAGLTRRADVGVSSPAAYLSHPEPAYPDAARRLRQEGRVQLRVRVDTDGRPGEVQIAASSGVASLDQAAIRAVRHWRFTPTRRNGQSIADWVRIPIQFTLTH